LTLVKNTADVMATTVPLLPCTTCLQVNVDGKAHTSKSGNGKSLQTFTQHLGFAQHSEEDLPKDQQRPPVSKPEEHLEGDALEAHELIHGEQGLTSWLALALANREMAQVHGAATHLPQLLLEEHTLPLSPARLQDLADNHPAKMINWGDPCNSQEVGWSRQRHALHVSVWTATVHTW
jgi:hypothetical protein